MKKIVLVLLFAVCATIALSAARNIAVMTFDVAGNAVTEEEAEGITELFISELASTGKSTVVDRANFDKIIKEINFQNSDWSDKEKTAKLGKAINASIIVRGKITKLGSRIYLSVTFIDIVTAEIISSGREEFFRLDDIFSQLGYLAKDLLAGLLYTKGPGGGTIFHIDGNTYYEAVFFPHETGNIKDIDELGNSYRNGKYKGWRFPTEKEFKLIFENLFIDARGKIKNKELSGFYYHGTGYRWKDFIGSVIFGPPSIEGWWGKGTRFFEEPNQYGDNEVKMKTQNDIVYKAKLCLVREFTVK